MNKLIFALLLLAVSVARGADYQKDIDDFFALYSAGKPADAVDSIYASNKYFSEKKDDANGVKKSLISIYSDLGALDTLKKIGEYRLGDLMVHVTYLAIHDRQPLRFEFQFFKKKSGWSLNTFSFNAPGDELEILARRDALAGNKVNF